jgi:hypothetical protein
MPTLVLTEKNYKTTFTGNDLQPQVVVLGDGEQEVRIFGVELELVDALAVADVVLHAVHGGGAEDADDAAKAGSRQERLAGLAVVRPGTDVMILKIFSTKNLAKKMAF